MGYLGFELIAVVAGFLAGFVGSIAGGGGGFFGLFGMILLGLPLPSAIASYRLADLGISVGVFLSFKNKNLIQKEIVLPLAFIQIISMAAGTILVVQLSDVRVRDVIVIAMIISLYVTFLRPNDGLVDGKVNKFWIPASSVAGVYNGLIGAGGGPINMIILMSLRGLTALKALGNYFAAYFWGTLVSTAIFAYFGLINYYFAVIMFVSQIIGAFLGSKISLKGGNNFIKICMRAIIAGIILKVVFFP